jgi:hypothetical protein
MLDQLQTLLLRRATGLLPLLSHHVGRDTARTATLERAALFTATRPAFFCRARAMVDGWS